MAESEIPLVAVVGPTASGKTTLAVALCEELNGEVVSCDSMQIYKGMEIATAKPAKSEMNGIPHHLMDFLEADESYSVARYCEDAKRIIADIHSRGKIPVLAGGTGLYYTSLVDNITFFEEKSDFEYRDFLKSRAEREGTEILYNELKLSDPDAADEIDENNIGRVIRALEIIHTTGKTKTEQNRLSKCTPSPYKLRGICLDARNRQYLYDRINRRVDDMVSRGLVAEAEDYYKSGLGKTACQAIGYKELYPYFSGEKSLDECIERLKIQTRRYAKRQLTWFRRDERLHFIYIDDYENFSQLKDAVLSVLNGE